MDYSVHKLVLSHIKNILNENRGKKIKTILRNDGHSLFIRGAIPWKIQLQGLKISLQVGWAGTSFSVNFGRGMGTVGRLLYKNLWSLDLPDPHNPSYDPDRMAIELITMITEIEETFDACKEKLLLFGGVLCSPPSPRKRKKRIKKT